MHVDECVYKERYVSEKKNPLKMFVHISHTSPGYWRLGPLNCAFLTSQFLFVAKSTTKG